MGKAKKEPGAPKRPKPPKPTKAERKRLRKEEKYAIFKSSAIINAHIGVVDFAIVIIIMVCFLNNCFTDDEERTKFTFENLLLVVSSALSLIMFLGWYYTIRYFIVIYFMLIPVLLVAILVHLVVYSFRLRRCIREKPNESDSTFINDTRCYFTMIINTMLLLLNIILGAYVFIKFRQMYQRDLQHDEFRSRVGWFITRATSTVTTEESKNSPPEDLSGSGSSKTRKGPELTANAFKNKIQGKEDEQLLPKTVNSMEGLALLDEDPEKDVVSSGGAEPPKKDNEKVTSKMDKTNSTSA